MAHYKNDKITAQVVADSITDNKDRITTVVLTIPRIVLAELNTHRAFSRNSSSSRAIPLSKMIEMVKTNLFIPTKFQKHHSGMQGSEYLEGRQEKRARILWKLASRCAITFARLLNNVGVTKQLCNRILEPFMYHTVIITATDWENFIALRAHDAAEIHIQDAAYKIMDALNASQPRLLKPGMWHIPFGDNIKAARIAYECGAKDDKTPWNVWKWQRRVEIATARCARVSYMNFHGKDDYEADMKLHDRLLQDGHMSPFEHCAIASKHSSYSGNFKGWIQYRKTLKWENKRDNRLIQK